MNARWRFRGGSVSSCGRRAGPTRNYQLIKPVKMIWSDIYCDVRDDIGERNPREEVVKSLMCGEYVGGRRIAGDMFIVLRTGVVKRVVLSDYF